jgi:hypothetical protein
MPVLDRERSVTSSNKTPAPLSTTAPPVAGTGDNYLDQLLDDPTFGTLNRFVAKEVGSTLTPQKLGVEIGILNISAKEAKMSEAEAMDMFVRGLKDAKKMDLSAISALHATSGAIAFRIALEEGKK